MKKHYRVDDEKKVVTANVELLTDDEIKVIEKFTKLGYEVKNGAVTKTEKKTEKKADKKKPKLNEAFILEYLAGNEKALKEYSEAKGEAATDDNGNIKTTKKGKTRTKGFNAGKMYFIKNFPVDENIKKEIDDRLTQQQKDDLAAAWEKYKNNKLSAEDKEKGKEKLTEEQYKRYFYWTRVFGK